MVCKIKIRSIIFCCGDNKRLPQPKLLLILYPQIKGNERIALGQAQPDIQQVQKTVPIIKPT